MPARDSAPLGAPCWIDLAMSDPAGGRAFYTELFGWTAREPNAEFGDYVNYYRNGIRIAGSMPAQPGGVPNVWSTYLAVADAAKTLEVASANGAQIYVPAMQVGDLGAMGVLADPGGAVIGIWQPGLHTGFGLLAEHGTPGWFELLARDYAGSLDFYRTVFGWDTEPMGDTDEFRYTVVKHGKDQVAGVMDAADWLPEGVPPHWAVYFAVDDTDASVTKLQQLGGTVTEPATDTPYGRMASVTDPFGARFKLIGPNDQMPAND